MRRNTLKWLLLLGILLGYSAVSHGQDDAAAAVTPEDKARQTYQSVSDLFYNWKAVVGRVAIDLQALQVDFKQTDFKVSGTYSERLACGGSLSIEGLPWRGTGSLQPH